MVGYAETAQVYVSVSDWKSQHFHCIHYTEIPNWPADTYNSNTVRDPFQHNGSTTSGIVPTNSTSGRASTGHPITHSSYMMDHHTPMAIST